MTIIDTSSWPLNDNLGNFNNASLQAYTNNLQQGYTLIESETNTFAGTSGSGGFNPFYNEYRWDTAIVPGVGGNIPTPGLFNRNTLAHGKSVRPPQNLSWEASGGQHIHMSPEIDSVTVGYNNNSQIANNYQPSWIRFNLRHWYGSLTQNFSFPNFNDAQYEIDIHIWQSADDTSRISILNWPIATTGAPSTIVFGALSKARNFLRRGSFGVTEFIGYSINHVPSSSQITGNLVDVFGTLGGGQIQPGAPQPGKIVIGYRIHSQAAPFTRVNVPRITNPDMILAQTGIYSTGEDFTERPTDNIQLGDSISVNFVESVPESHSVSLLDGVSLSGVVTTNVESHDAHSVTLSDTIRMGDTVAPQVSTEGPTSHSVSLAGRVRLSGSLVADQAFKHVVSPQDRVQVSGAIGVPAEQHRVRLQDNIWLTTDFTSVYDDDARYEITDVISVVPSIRVRVDGEEILDLTPVGEGGSFITVVGRRLFRKLTRV